MVLKPPGGAFDTGVSEGEFCDRDEAPDEVRAADLGYIGVHVGQAVLHVVNPNLNTVGLRLTLTIGAPESSKKSHDVWRALCT